MATLSGFYEAPGGNAGPARKTRRGSANPPAIDGKPATTNRAESVEGVVLGDRCLAGYFLLRQWQPGRAKIAKIPTKLLFFIACLAVKHSLAKPSHCAIVFPTREQRFTYEVF
jgi:hypothetical protein